MKVLSPKHARRRFTVARDVHGVPHIAADSWRSALYGLGYMHGIDRPTQMLFARAVASGRATELIAEGYLAVNWEATVADVAPLVHAHPTLSEVFGEAALALTGRSLH